MTKALRCELLHERGGVRVCMVQPPALNTPQFSWVKTRLPQRPQPVAPIYQPEVAADAIVWAADHFRPEIYVGLSTLVAIVGNKLAPRLGDRYLAWTGYDAQQADGAVSRDRSDNLWEPVLDDRGAHSDFDARAHGRSLQWWLSKRRGRLALVSAGLTALAALVLRGRQSQSDRREARADRIRSVRRRVAGARSAARPR